ncbi:MAG: hypothetical protein Q8912_16360 [Bacillota bacterium]|nr:hypothetical protein [Bacillota bacterium]
MRDRMYYGFISGLIAGIAINLWSLLSYYILDFSQIRIFDFASEIMYGRLPLNAFDSLLAWSGQMIFCGF